MVKVKKLRRRDGRLELVRVLGQEDLRMVKVKKLRRRDGRLELVRVLGQEDLRMVKVKKLRRRDGQLELVRVLGQEDLRMVKVKKLRRRDGQLELVRVLGQEDLMMVKVKKLRRRDGRLELVRVLGQEDLNAWSRTDPLAYEKSIVWMEDISNLPYVRVFHVRAARSRRGPLQLSGGVRVVGYAKLTPDAPRNPDGATYTRRMFYLKADDLQQNHGVPEDALDPRTVLPGTSGRPAGS